MFFAVCVFLKKFLFCFLIRLISLFPLYYGLLFYYFWYKIKNKTSTFLSLPVYATTEQKIYVNLKRTLPEVCRPVRSSFIRLNQPHPERRRNYRSLSLSITPHSLPLLICRRESLLGLRPFYSQILQLGRTGPSVRRSQLRVQIALAAAVLAAPTKEPPRQLVLDALPNGRRLSYSADGTVLAARTPVVGTGGRGRCCGCSGGGGDCSPVPPAPTATAPGSAGRERRGGRRAGRHSHLRHHHRSQSHGRCCGR